MIKSKNIRISSKVLEWRNKKKQELGISDSQLFDALLYFLKKENLEKWFDDAIRKELKRREKSII